ncbi:MAG: hypothetical protein IPM17_18480 [Verrucomicrobia bacterium]|nr:hypothetical protein [Verrucomicrobiota bacterium]
MKQRVSAQLWATAGLSFAILFFSGCANPKLHVTRTAPAPSAPGGRAVKVYEIGDRVDRPYEIVGVVSATGQRAGVRSKARKQLLAEAAALGADALVGYYYDQEITAPTGDADGWAGALAVKFLPSGSPAPAPSKAVVALPHTILGPDFGTGRKAEKADAIARKHARMLLAKKGYYVVFTEDKLASGFPDGLKSLSAADRANYGSPDADLVLAVSLGDRTAFNAILVVNASQALTTALYSKSADAVVWQSAGKGASFDVTELGAAFGIGHLFVPSAKTVVSVHAALARAFETLPDLTQAPAAK